MGYADRDSSPAPPGYTSKAFYCYTSLFFGLLRWQKNVFIKRTLHLQNPYYTSARSVDSCNLSMSCASPFQLYSLATHRNFRPVFPLYFPTIPLSGIGFLFYFISFLLTLLSILLFPPPVVYFFFFSSATLV
jgi:hypothetical protein